jgi:hypothetical protein
MTGRRLRIGPSIARFMTGGGDRQLPGNSGPPGG